MYSFTDLAIAVGCSLMIGFFIGIALMGLCSASGREKEQEEFHETIKSYQNRLAEKDRIIMQKNKHIIRFKYKTLEAVQQYLQDDVVACTMIIATINGIKEEGNQ